ncbi:hypothetical protein MM26B8_03840 [Mycoplasmopsis meleagridis]|uniref:ABC transporter substrate-binding protein PnrA-like domain-containing protein n=1 Tax=Mycoplasmopsis meleagridis ATCC 25294 TaxID=1264554 RepID=A0A0F5H0Z3_9BACT|nr:BMP family ABC transporter substrate-binding protein [Mycoplasmopsis meleagridis]KKB26800.1 hypothetical protein MMELEA_01910 [Mycoplasmopsis meleagridis ATCC 25294]OAD18083.1 hypothetical protein MM26B8_03840 [Mycoplasmopsis meleagridis]VEU77335.1 Uncharacterised protein [Mycoplasmopsis meleagridis]
MKKLTKSWLTMGGLFAASVPALAAVSCEENYVHRNAPAEKDRIAEIVLNNDFKITNDNVGNNNHVAVVTDGGDIDDKSFNQSSWEGVIRLMEQNKISPDNYAIYQTQNNNFSDQYNAALDNGSRYIVLTGFHHLDPLLSWIKQDGVLKRIKDNNVIFLTIDFAIDTNSDGARELAGHTIALTYDVKQAAYMAGWAAGEFLKEKYANEPEKRNFGTFGGGTFPGVTDFNEGFMKGLIDYNKENPEAKVTIKTKNKGNVYLNSLFEINDSSKQSEVRTEVLDLNPTLVLPVAGRWNQYVSANHVQYIVGVDTDQALGDDAHKDVYLTSILKAVGQSVYDTIGYLLTTDLTNGELTKSKLGGFELNKTSGSFNKGYADKWVGLAQTHLEGGDKALAEKAIEVGKAKYSALSSSDKEWLESNKVTRDGQVVQDGQKRINDLALLLDPSAVTTPTVTTPTPSVPNVSGSGESTTTQGSESSTSGTQSGSSTPNAESGTSSNTNSGTTTEGAATAK